MKKSSIANEQESPELARPPEVPDEHGEVRAVSVEERIQRRAYELYEARGQLHGHDIEDWLQAEEELTRLPRDSGSRDK